MDTSSSGAMAVKMFIAFLASQKVSALLARVGVIVDPNVAGAAFGTGLHWLHMHYKGLATFKKKTVTTTTTIPAATV